MDYRPRMLLVYRDSEIASRCGRILRRRGWDVHLSGSAHEARRLVRTLAPQLVVVDCAEPDFARDGLGPKVLVLDQAKNAERLAECIQALSD
jgi:ActR/RegA family two-component response regulator